MKNIETKKTRVLLYSPYLDVIGGGERHILSVLKVFADNGYSIDIAWDDKNILNQIEKKLHITLKGVRIIPTTVIRTSIPQRLMNLKKYDYFFYVSDGSYFYSTAKHNYMYAMYPQKDLYNMGFVNRIKLFNYEVMVNGVFSAKFIDDWFGKSPKVLHPYVEEKFFELGRQNSRKEKIILSVGRFFGHLHSKRQDVLVEAFLTLQKKDKRFKEYRLVLAGGLKDEEVEYYYKLKKLINNSRSIELVLNPNFAELLTYYKKAEFYWHAAGYGVDEMKEPTRVEHLGIAPLEAMASGAVVFCHNSGGPKRIIKDGATGFLYNDRAELINKMMNVGKGTISLSEIRKYGMQYAEGHFSEKVFRKEVENYFKL